MLSESCLFCLFVFLVYSMDNLKVTWFQVFLRGFIFKLTWIWQQARDWQQKAENLEMCQAMEASILRLKFCCRKSAKWTFVYAGGWELLYPNLSTYLNLKGISWLQRVQLDWECDMWPFIFYFFENVTFIYQEPNHLLVPLVEIETKQGEPHGFLSARILLWAIHLLCQCASAAWRRWLAWQWPPC